MGRYFFKNFKLSIRFWINTKDSKPDGGNALVKKVIQS